MLDTRSTRLPRPAATRTHRTNRLLRIGSEVSKNSREWIPLRSSRSGPIRRCIWLVKSISMYCRTFRVSIRVVNSHLRIVDRLPNIVQSRLRRFYSILWIIGFVTGYLVLKYARNTRPDPQTTGLPKGRNMLRTAIGLHIRHRLRLRFLPGKVIWYRIDMIYFIRLDVCCFTCNIVDGYGSSIVSRRCVDLDTNRWVIYGSSSVVLLLNISSCVSQTGSPTFGIFSKLIIIEWVMRWCIYESTLVWYVRVSEAACVRFPVIGM